MTRKSTGISIFTQRFFGGRKLIINLLESIKKISPAAGLPVVAATILYGMDLRNDNARNMLRKYVILCTVQLSLTGRTGVSMIFSRQKYESMRKIYKIQRIL